MKENTLPIILASVAVLLCAIIIALTAFSVTMHATKNSKPITTETNSPSVSDDPDTDVQVPTASPSPTINNSPSKTPEDPSVKNTALLKETEDAGQSYIDSLTFLGDSTTYHLYEHEMLQNGHDSRQVWFGAQGNTITFQFLESVQIKDNKNGTPCSIKEMLSSKKPEILYVTLGVTGGVSQHLGEEQFKAIYKYLIQLVLDTSPNTKLVCNSIFPVCKTTKFPKISIEGIKEANQWIFELADQYYKEGKKVYYLDSFSALAIENGFLPDSYSNGDGLHMNPKGYKVLLQYIRTHKIPD